MVWHSVWFWKHSISSNLETRHDLCALTKRKLLYERETRKKKKLKKKHRVVPTYLSKWWLFSDWLLASRCVNGLVNRVKEIPIASHWNMSRCCLHQYRNVFCMSLHQIWIRYNGISIRMKMGFCETLSTNSMLSHGIRGRDGKKGSDDIKKTPKTRNDKLINSISAF